LNSKYILFKYKPELQFSEFLVNFGGLLGLWHGISLLELKNVIINFVERKLFAFIRIRRLWTYFAILNFFKKIIGYCKLQVKTQKVRAHNAYAFLDSFQTLPPLCTPLYALISVAKRLGMAGTVPESTSLSRPKGKATP
jgi:hypothetical protein